MYAPEFSWKDFTCISGGKFGLLVKFGVLALLVALCNVFALEFGSKSDITREFEGVALIWISQITTVVFLALDAARIFQEEIRWKTLSSLVTLPISVPELAYRKVAHTGWHAPVVGRCCVRSFAGAGGGWQILWRNVQ